MNCPRPNSVNVEYSRYISSVHLCASGSDLTGLARNGHGYRSSKSATSSRQVVPTTSSDAKYVFRLDARVQVTLRIDGRKDKCSADVSQAGMTSAVS
jgi:hypothetical protein